MIREEIETFEQAAGYLYRVPRFTSKNSPEDTRRFLHMLGDPDKGRHIIHVAGTNGKGSVCAYLRSILETAGKRVAIFTSPHLVDIRERFMICGAMISKEDFCRAFHGVYDKLDWEKLQKGEGYHPTYFEFLFFMAMLLFAEEKPDYCILETGLGGRLDATNSVRDKELTVITRISLDHVEYLGNTVEKIAGEKAGILRKGVPLVFSDVEPDATRVFLKEAEMLGIPVYGVSKNDYVKYNFKNKFIDFSLKSRYYGYVSLSLNTIAGYQAENAALAVRAIEILDKGRTITLQQIREGLFNSIWPGRMEEILPEVYLDGAHNEDGVRAFMDTVRCDGFDGKRRLLFGVVQDKDYGSMLKELTQENCFISIAIAHLHTDRSASLENIDKIMKRYPGCAYTLYKDVRTALYELMAGRCSGERLYIAGSLYLAGEIKELLDHDKF